MKKVRSASQIRQAEVAKDTKRKLNKDRRRIAELDTIIKKLYESFAIGRITDERFDTLLAEYEAEQKTLVTSVSDAESHLSSFEEDTDRAAQFLSLAKKYTDFSELTTPMINEFIEKIIVHAPEKIDGDRVQEVEIYLKFIGRFELPEPELTPEEIKRQEQLRRHRIKSRERYQKIKAGEHAVGQPFKLICKCCGEEFESKRSNTLFCSPKCRTKFYRQEAAENRKRECVCENCGKTFTATRKDVKYCCDDCRTEANRRMQKERNAAKQIKEKEPVLLDAPPMQFPEDATADSFRKEIRTLEAGLKKLETSEARYTVELDDALKQYAEFQEQAAELDPAELYEARQTIRSGHEQSAIQRVQDAYGDKYNLLMMFESGRDVGELLNEEMEARSLRERLRQKQQRKKQINKESPNTMSRNGK